jgi:hypothetical protein
MRGQDTQGVTYKVLARRRILDEAWERFKANDSEGTMCEVLRFLGAVQATDESVIELHRECLAMTELCRKAIESEGLRAPIIITSPPIRKDGGS